MKMELAKKKIYYNSSLLYKAITEELEVVIDKNQTNSCKSEICCLVFHSHKKRTIALSVTICELTKRN